MYITICNITIHMFLLSLVYNYMYVATTTIIYHDTDDTILMNYEHTSNQQPATINQQDSTATHSTFILT